MRPQNDLSFEIETQGPEHTQRVAAVLVQELGPGSVLALEGPLGAGKTTFVQGAALGLQLPAGSRVKSPTYALWATYPTTPPLHHMDFYRLGDEDEAFAMGLHEGLEEEQAIACVEWPGRCPNLLPAHTIWVFFPNNAGDVRILRFKVPEHWKYEQAQKLRGALEGA